MALDPETFDALVDHVRRFVTERLRPLPKNLESGDAPISRIGGYFQLRPAPVRPRPGGRNRITARVR